VRVEATRVVAAPRRVVFAFLSDLENHWELGGRFIKVLDLDRSSPEAPAHGGRVAMHGPLGITRAVRTRVAEVNPPDSMAGTAEIGSRTRSRVRWTFAPDGNATEIGLAAEVESASALDRLLLLAGGLAWLRRRFDEVLERLDERVSTRPR
jgi:carbon monoxide dehydrogenase subunit G